MNKERQLNCESIQEELDNFGDIKFSEMKPREVIRVFYPELDDKYDEMDVMDIIKRLFDLRDLKQMTLSEIIEKHCKNQK